MKSQLALSSLLLATSGWAIGAQGVATPASLATFGVIDSLKAGQKRWDSAKVIEYSLQSHVSCFCGYRLEQLRDQLPLLTIRKQSIVSRAKGKPNTRPSPDLTIETLFARIDEDARSDGRIIDRLELHPVYGFPVRYRAHDPQIPDDWVEIQVDSFAVIRAK